uniref:Innexin n=1 Tax=Panagrolaimus sp. PS1159 TaxID=55785 RepID=A0AC35FXI7_9BILA
MVVEIPLIKKCLQNAIKGQLIGDSIDWLSYYGTTWLFWFFALLTSAKQYFGSPIQCFTPAEFGKSWENYAETYCFINNIYKLPMEQEFPDPADRKDQISYYRWVPLILLCQGCSFYLINALWEFLNKKSVINCEEIVKDAQTCTLKEKNRQTKLENISQYIFDTFRYEFPLNGHFYNNGYCTATFYLLTKFLNLINCCLNLFLLESFLGTQLLKYGL